MHSIDVRLNDQIQQSYAYLSEHYGRINKERISAHNAKKEKDIHLELKSFRTIIEECKEEVEQNSIEEIENTLALVYHVDTQGDLTHSVMEKITALNMRFLKAQQDEHSITEELLQEYRDDIRLIDRIIDAIESRIYQLEHNRRWFHFSHKQRITHYQDYLEKFKLLQDEMVRCFELMSNMVTNFIVESFHYLYLFFAFVIKLFVLDEKDHALIEIAATIDRYKKVMKPLRPSGALQREFLRNSYVVQEFSALQKVIYQNI